MKSSLCFLFSPAVEFEVGKEVKWIKFNVGQRGFYRVTYDEGGWDALIHVLQTEPQTLSPADRASLLDDAFTLVKYVFILSLSPFLFPVPP